MKLSETSPAQEARSIQMGAYFRETKQMVIPKLPHSESEKKRMLVNR